MKTILDVSNIVYGGHFGSPDYRISGFPVGGLRKLFGIVNADISSADVYLCMDGGATLKKELLPTYKAGRVPDYSVMAQIEVIKEVCDRCKIPYYCKPGYEADDYICSLVSYFSRIGDDSEIVIYSDDRDISCCVGDNVEVRAVTTQGSRITKDNYETTVKKGKHIPYNTILLHKIVHGDDSDNYTGLKSPRFRFEDLALRITETLAPYFESGAITTSAYFNADVAKAVFAEAYPNLSPEEIEAVDKQIDIVYPFIVDVLTAPEEEFFAACQTSGQSMYILEKQFLKGFDSTTIDDNLFGAYCTALNLRRFDRSTLLWKYQKEIDEFKELLHSKAEELSTGVTATKYSKLKHSTMRKESVKIQNMDLPL